MHITMKGLLFAALAVTLVAARGGTAAVSRADRGDGRAADGDSIPRYRLEEIVVTAKRAGSPIEDLALSVGLLDRRDVELSIANSSTDLAGSLPGVFIQRTGAFGRSDVNIRGLGSRGRRAVVLVDGRPERMALFDCTVTHSFLLHDVNRIEVVRGPFSVLYGSGAMGGVLNVIPRRVEEDLELDLKTGGGSHGTAVASGRIGGRRGKGSGSVSVDYRRSDGHIGHSYYTGTDIAARGGYELGDAARLAVSARYFDGYKEEPPLATAGADAVPNVWNQYRRGAVDAGVAGARGAVDYRAQYYRSFGEHEFGDGWHSRDATDGVTAQLLARPLDRLEIGLGGDFRYQWGERLNDPPGEWSKWEGGGYVTAEYRPVWRITLSGGARYEEDEIAGGILCPSFGLIVRPLDGTTLRASAGRAFRSPQLNELYLYPFSNEELGAETLWNYEAGLRQSLFSSVFADLVVFWMEGEDFIETVRNTAPPPLFRFENTGRFEFTGLEAAVGGSWRDDLSGSLSYSFIDVGERTTGRPGRKLDAEVSWRISRLTVRITGTHVEDYFAADAHRDPIDAYTLLGAYSEVRVGRGLTAFAGVDNLLDEDHVLFVDLPGGEAGLYEMPGITFIGGIKYGL